MRVLLNVLLLVATLTVAAPVLADCTGNVIIGEGETQITTSVPNRNFHGTCLNALIVDTAAEGANYGSHIEFVADLTKLVSRLIKSREISLHEGGQLLAAAARSDVGKTITVRVIALNDFHGSLESPGTFRTNATSPALPSGGIDVLAGYVAADKAASRHHVVVAAGDLIGASPLLSAFFHDEGTIETMNRLGLEFNAVGNHEFDEGKDELLRMQNGGCHPTDPANTCKGANLQNSVDPAAATPVPFEGAKFKFLSANVVDTSTGRTLFPAYGVKTFKGHRVAFIGMTLKETPSIVTPSGVAGLDFKDEADTVNALIQQLRHRGIKAIVVLVHQGGFQSNVAPNPSLVDINACASADASSSLDGSDASVHLRQIISRLNNGVDLVISAHTHAAYNCLLPNASGRRIPVTSASAFGRVLTIVDLTIDTRSGDVVKVAASNKVVDRSNAAVTPNAAIAGIVAGYKNLVSPLANAVIGAITADATNTANAAGEMGAGDLIADAQLAATQPAQFGSALIAFMNAGGVRNPGFIFNQQSGTEAPGEVTYGEAFTVQPFGNSLVTLTLTGQQIKDLLEQQFAVCLGQTSQRIMQVSNGFSYSWSTSAAPCSKVSNIQLNGAPIDPGMEYRVTVNNFMATGGDGFTVLIGGTNALGGAQDIDAVVAYLADFKSPNAPYNPADPVLHKPRITQLP